LQIKKLEKRSKKIRRKNLLKLEFFLLKLILFVLPLYVIMQFGLPLLSVFLLPAQIFLAWATHSMLALFGFPVILNGVYLIMRSGLELFVVEITADCTAWKSMYILTALVFATPISNLTKKTRFLALWLPIVFFVNYLRILTTVLIVLIAGFQYLGVVHTILWREGMIVLIIAIWYLWFRGKI